MDEQEMLKQITSLQMEVDQLKALMQRLLFALLAHENDQYPQLQSLFQELQRNSKAPITDIEQQIRQELRAGNKFKAVNLYRVFYHVSLKEAQDAINKM